VTGRREERTESREPAVRERVPLDGEAQDEDGEGRSSEQVQTAAEPRCARSTEEQTHEKTSDDRGSGDHVDDPVPSLRRRPLRSQGTFSRLRSEPFPMDPRRLAAEDP
jgi:hypothetical protein